ncbi:hypothetical protein QBC37DRAFT_465035 [Rhypophila decipiens]|uniref:Uncharacterized protein n=1 Tax=Rhypophila decipiens TaxID=261697 RepID=A0AAN6Y533_9PEZI|nr:hypothetical protein QBC37DRAFT_465035 [Rhypophila decipiens]
MVDLYDESDSEHGQVATKGSSQLVVRPKTNIEVVIYPPSQQSRQSRPAASKASKKRDNTSQDDEVVEEARLIDQSDDVKESDHSTSDAHTSYFREPTPERKRVTRASTAPKKQAATIRSVDELPKWAQKPTEMFLTSLVPELDRVGKTVKHSLQRIKSIEDVKELLPLAPITDTWTAEESKKLRNERDKLCRSSAATKRLLSAGQGSDLMTLYKKCLRLYRCFPDDIISVDNNLVYHHPENNRPLKDGYENPNWVNTFCRNLNMVLQHGMFAGSQKLFATAIQYVIKVENGDQTPWWIEGETLEVPRRLQQLSRSNLGTGCPSSISTCWNKRQSLENHLGACSSLQLSVWSRKETSRCKDAGMGFAGVPMYRPTRLIAAMTTQARSGPYDYPTKKDMKEVRKYALHRRREKDAIREKEMAAAERAGYENSSDEEAEDDQGEVEELVESKESEDDEVIQDSSAENDQDGDTAMEDVGWLVFGKSHRRPASTEPLEQDNPDRDFPPDLSMESGMQLDHQPPLPQHQPSNAEDNSSCDAEDLAIRYPILGARIQELTERERQRQALLAQQPNHVQELERLVQIQALEELLETSRLEQLEQA